MGTTFFISHVGTEGVVMSSSYAFVHFVLANSAFDGMKLCMIPCFDMQNPISTLPSSPLFFFHMDRFNSTFNIPIYYESYSQKFKRSHLLYF
jgi:hypothetical protein